MDFVHAFMLGFDVMDAIWNGGKTKFSIEYAMKTRIVIADTKIHILLSYQNIKVAIFAAGKRYTRKLRQVTGDFDLFFFVMLRIH